MKKKNFFPGASLMYALPLRICWILIGYIYFSAGFWKWWKGGFDWVFSQNLVHHMYVLWYFFPDWEPLWRVDRYPFLSPLMAMATLVFELSFIFLIFFPRLRYIAVFAGYSFHKLIIHLMHINFSALTRSYVIFFDWYKIIHGLQRKVLKKAWIAPNVYPEPAGKGYLYTVLFVGSILVIGNFFHGARLIHSWPLTCFPTFSEVRLKPLDEQIEMVMVDREGLETTLTDHPVFQEMGMSRFYGFIKEVLKIKDKAEQEIRLAALWELLLRNDPDLARIRTVKFYKVVVNLVPERRNQNPLSRELVLTFQAR
jgi:hypothetical protein